MSIPERFHFYEVYEGVMGRIEQAENGRSDRWYNFINVLVKKIVYSLNHSTNELKSFNAPYRGF